MTHWRELITHGTPQEPVPQKQMMNTPPLLTSGAGETGQLRALIEKHRRHVELSPGVGADVQQYALGCFDDLLSDLVAASGETAPEQQCEGVTARWCPNCGTCICPSQDNKPDEWEANPLCPIHGDKSPHPLSTPPATTALREALTVVEEIREAAKDLRHDAADWRETSDKTGGHAAVSLMRDALANEELSERYERWADLLDAALRTQEQS